MTHHWDEFSKSLAEKSVPRRQSLRLLGVALAGALLGPLGLGTAWAGGLDPCKSFCNRYPKGVQSRCLTACQSCNGDTSRVCENDWYFACCPVGRPCCNGYCADLASDFDHCGACGNPCPYPGPYEDGACVDGQCLYWCVEGAADCGDGACTDLLCDPDNCGACGNACPEAAPSVPVGYAQQRTATVPTFSGMRTTAESVAGYVDRPRCANSATAVTAALVWAKVAERLKRGSRSLTCGAVETQCRRLSRQFTVFFPCERPQP